MPTESRSHQIDEGQTVEGYGGYDGSAFMAFAQAETVPFVIRITSTIGIDFSAYQIFVSFTDIDADSTGPMTDSEFAESQLSYTGTVEGDPNTYIFSGAVTDEQTILLPEGVGTVIGAIKLINPEGASTFIDKAKITVFPSNNPRLDQE